MAVVNMHDAKSQLSQLVEAAERGEIVVIARNGKPAAQLVGLGDKPHLRSWSPQMARWFTAGLAQDFEVERSDLRATPERELF